MGVFFQRLQGSEKTALLANGALSGRGQGSKINVVSRSTVFSEPGIIFTGRACFLDGAYSDTGADLALIALSGKGACLGYTLSLRGGAASKKTVCLVTAPGLVHTAGLKK